MIHSVLNTSLHLSDYLNTGEEVTPEKSWENRGKNFGICLVKICRKNYCLRKNSLNNLPK